MKVEFTNIDGKACVSFKCPGCGWNHHLTVNGRKNGAGATWQFNGDVNNPTITPSIKAWSDYDDHSTLTDADYGPWYPHPKVAAASTRDVLPGSKHKLVHVTFCCHSFVTNGKIQFLNDCTHDLKGQTIELPELGTVTKPPDEARPVK